MCGLVSADLGNGSVDRECIGQLLLLDCISEIMDSEYDPSRPLTPSQLSQPPGPEERDNLVNLARQSAYEAQQQHAGLGVRTYQNVPDCAFAPMPAIRVTNSSRQTAPSSVNQFGHQGSHVSALNRSELPQLRPNSAQKGQIGTATATKTPAPLKLPAQTPDIRTSLNSPILATSPTGIPGSPTLGNSGNVFVPYQNIPSPPIAATQPASPLTHRDIHTADNSGGSLQTARDRSLERLYQTGYYYGQMTAQAARDTLRQTDVGTFLVRASSDPLALASLSVKTPRGTTAIRILYANGLFRLDCGPQSVHKMATSDCVVKLIEHYMSESTSESGNKCVFLEGSGRRDTPLVLTRPLLRLGQKTQEKHPVKGM